MTTQTTIPTSIRCLAVLPAIIMLGGYALLGPKPVANNSTATAVVPAAQNVVASLPSDGGKLIASESANLTAAR